ncbi:ComF family protein [Candidatus Saccharibacteria bacterium]|nr:ComF family protein [Candidatus Saccharibacteria bacterium]
MAFIVNNTTFPNPLDLFAPHSCRGCGRIGNVLCRRCKKYIIDHHKNFCPKCKDPTPNSKCEKCKIPTTYILGERAGLLDLLIQDYKYNSVRSLGPVLAELLDEIIPTLPRDSILVPLPTSFKHIRKRALDHTFLIAKHFAKKRHLKVERLLLRAKDTVQVGSDRSTRLKQAEEAYAINPQFTIDPSKTYILFDDIWTTGASMNFCIKKLHQSGANKIIVILLAVSKN